MRIMGKMTFMGSMGSMGVMGLMDIMDGYDWAVVRVRRRWRVRLPGRAAGAAPCGPARTVSARPTASSVDALL